MFKAIKITLLLIIFGQIAHFCWNVRFDISAVDRVGLVPEKSGIDVDLEARPIASDHGHDLATVHLPHRLYLAGLISNGLWPDREYIGRWETAVFYPVNYLYAALPPLGALIAEIAFHLFIIGWGTYIFCRSLGRSREASLLAALLVATSGQVYGRLYPGHLSNLATMAWAPFIFLFINRGSFWGLAGSLILQILAGHPQYVFYTGMAAGIYMLVSWPKRPLAIVGAYLTAALITLPQTIPAIEAYRASPRVSIDAGFAESFYFSIENIISSVLPFYWGTFDRFPPPFNAWEMSFFFGGIGAVILAGIGWTPRFLFLAGLTFLIACGIQTPIYFTLYDNLPIFGSFRGVCKFLFFTVFFCSVMAANGFDRLK